MARDAAIASDAAAGGLGNAFRIPICGGAGATGAVILGGPAAGGTEYASLSPKVFAVSWDMMVSLPNDRQLQKQGQ
jgi:hypothetical protein